MHELNRLRIARIAGVGVALAALALACNRSDATPALPVATAPPALPTEPPATPGALAPLPTVTPAGSEEAIQILEPGPGSRLTSPLHVAGLADPTFEQTLGVRLVLDDGTELAAGPAMIQAEIGTRGPFEGELAFSVTAERNASLQVFDASARDGGITHLASVGVTLAPSGAPEVLPAESRPEAIVITQPERGATISGGSVLVEGWGLASFEGTLVVEVYDADGLLVGSEPLIVEAPDIGLRGSFSITVTYAVGSAGPGRVRVVDPLPVFNGLGHIASIEVTLAP